MIHKSNITLKQTKKQSLLPTQKYFIHKIPTKKNLVIYKQIDFSKKKKEINFKT